MYDNIIIGLIFMSPRWPMVAEVKTKEQNMHITKTMTSMIKYYEKLK